jgi:hypothetical protein
MLPTYTLARDHLERAIYILRGTDLRSRQLCHILERTIKLMDQAEAPSASNVLDFETFRSQRNSLQGL